MKIAIFGVGLIGGSLALCFKDRPGIQVVGHSPNPASIEKYMQRNVVDEATTSMEEAAKDADFLFLCVPVGKLEAYLQALNGLNLKKGCIITDVGSTKQSITATAKRTLREDAYFIGGHPMAGKEKSGVEAATSRLFENAFYVLTPDKATPQTVYDRLSKLLSYTRAHIVRMDAKTHDDVVGAISHLPHVIAVALVNLIAGYNTGNELYANLAAGGFHDITRIASSDPVIWRDILLNNKTVVLELLKDWNAEIDKFSTMLIEDDGAGIADSFARAGEFRSRLPERRKGIITSQYDIYVDVPDEPGIIGKITSQLGNRKINLSNIHILENRLDVPGVLRLTFREEDDKNKAVLELQELGCTIQI